MCLETHHFPQAPRNQLCVYVYECVCQKAWTGLKKPNYNQMTYILTLQGKMPWCQISTVVYRRENLAWPVEVRDGFIEET